VAGYGITDAVATAQLTNYATTAQLITQLAPYQLATGSGAGLTELNASAAHHRHAARRADCRWFFTAGIAGE
jgi:hypothetical protein